MKQVETIYIPVGNDFAYCLVLDDLQPETITDLRAYVSTDGSKGNPYPAYIQDGEIRLDFTNTPQGYYNVWVEFVTNGAKVAVNLRNAFVVTEWSNVRANFQDYFAGSEYRVNVGAYLQPVNMGIPDAPVDGKQYARQNADWTEVIGLTPEQDNKLSAINDAVVIQTPVRYYVIEGEMNILLPFKREGRFCIGKPYTKYDGVYFVVDEDLETEYAIYVGCPVRKWSSTHYEISSTISATPTGTYGRETIKELIEAKGLVESIHNNLGDAEIKKSYLIGGHNCFRNGVAGDNYPFYTWNGASDGVGYVDTTRHPDLSIGQVVEYWNRDHPESSHNVELIRETRETALYLLREILAILKNL